MDFEIEFVGTRKESYNPETRNPNVEPGTLGRWTRTGADFTINAMAISLNQPDFGELVDPFNGLAHLEQQSIQNTRRP